jgi:hypothetical protein
MAVIGIRDIGWEDVDWIYLAQNGEQWPAHKHGTEWEYVSYRQENYVN